MESVQLQKSASPSATRLQLEGDNPFLLGRLWKVASAVKEAVDYLKGGSVGTEVNMESVTLQRVCIDQGEHRTAGGLRGHS